MRKSGLRLARTVASRTDGQFRATGGAGENRAMANLIALVAVAVVMWLSDASRLAWEATTAVVVLVLLCRMDARLERIEGLASGIHETVVPDVKL